MKRLIITVYAFRSLRRNARAETRTYEIRPGTEGRKQRFTGEDSGDLQTWAAEMTEQGYPYFQFTVLDGLDDLADGTCIWKNIHAFRQEPIENRVALCETVQTFFRLYNALLDAG